MPASLRAATERTSSEGYGENVCTLPNNQCLYFEVKTVVLPMPGERPSVTLTFPVCRLAEAMRARLNTIHSSPQVTQLQTTTPQGGETRMIYGPDMQYIAAPVCLVERFQARCGVGFLKTLNALALEVTLPEVG